jgi:hypothetical protein
MTMCGSVGNDRQTATGLGDVCCGQTVTDYAFVTHRVVGVTPRSIRADETRTTVIAKARLLD